MKRVTKKMLFFSNFKFCAAKIEYILICFILSHTIQVTWNMFYKNRSKHLNKFDFTKFRLKFTLNNAYDKYDKTRDWVTELWQKKI